jgi:hypothetical protein
VSVDSHADDDIAACAAADSTWYAFVLTAQNAADGALCATWALANKRLFMIDLADSEIKAGTGLANTVRAAANDYCAVSYHAIMSEFMSAAWLGNCLPMTPGSETWKFKTLGGVTADVLTDAEATFIEADNGNWYTSVGGISITQNGTCGKPQYIDVVRFIDWLKSNMQYDVYGVLTANKKVPYTDTGIALLEAAIRGRLKIGEDVGGLRAGESTVTLEPRHSRYLFHRRACRCHP